MAIRAIRAVESGVFDNPFDTMQFVAGRILGVRDNEGVKVHGPRQPAIYRGNSGISYEENSRKREGRG